MDLFDRWRKQADPPPPSPAGEPLLVVPDGHRLDTRRAMPWPCVTSSAAGVWLAHLGLSSDEPEEELDRVIEKIEVLLAGSRSQIRLVDARARISSLMSPGHPPEKLVSAHLIWTFDAAALAGAPRAAALVQRLLRCMYVTSRAAISQSAFALNAGTAPARALVTLVRELRIPVREPEKEDSTVLVEVHRPEGYVLSALIGAPPSNLPVAGSWAREVNDEKNRAAGDRERQARLEEEERHALEQRLWPDGGARPLAGIERAPRLLRILLDIAEKRGPMAKQALIHELLVREVPLLVNVDPSTKAARLRAWPGGYQALEVYADFTSLRATTQDRGLPTNSLAAAVMMPKALFAWAAGHEWAIALCAFLRSGKPVHIHLRAVEVRELAAGPFAKG